MKILLLLYCLYWRLRVLTTHTQALVVLANNKINKVKQWSIILNSQSLKMCERPKLCFQELQILFIFLLWHFLPFLHEAERLLYASHLLLSPFLARHCQRPIQDNGCSFLSKFAHLEVEFALELSCCPS